MVTALSNHHADRTPVLETFTFLDRHAKRDVAVTWKEFLREVPRLRVLPCTPRDLDAAWSYFARADLHTLSAVDAVSFALMTQ